MKKILCILFLLMALNVQAKEISVIAYGEGENYDWAVMNAVENAVRQSSTISVESNGLHKVDITQSISYDANSEAQLKVDEKVNIEGGNVKTGELNTFKGAQNVDASMKTKANETITANMQDNSKDILAKYTGSISSYEVLEHSTDEGIHKVKIKAVVIKEDVYDAHDYKSKSLVKKSNYSLAIMPFKIASNTRCLGQKINEKQINTQISNMFIEKLAPSRKFNLVDRNNLDDYSAEMAIIEDDMTLPENKVRLKNLVAADYILVGTVDNFTASSNKSVVALTGEINYTSTAKVKLSYRILETATMEIISAGSKEEKFSKEGNFSSCSNIQELLLGRAIDEISENILTDIFPDYKPIKKEVKKLKKKSRNSLPQQEPDYSLPLY